MQYPQIQFYRGSLVRLASGKLKQVEDLNSDDFIESAKLFASQQRTGSGSSACSCSSLAGSSNLDGNNQVSNGMKRQFSLIDDNNNLTTNSSSSVFNSPEPTPASFNSSPTNTASMDMMMDLEESEPQRQPRGEGGYLGNSLHFNHHLHHNNNNNNNNSDDDEDADIDVELDVVSCTNDELERTVSQHILVQSRNRNTNQDSSNEIINLSSSNDQRTGGLSAEELYIDSSVVRDFLEVGVQTGSPKSSNHNQASNSPPATTGSAPAPSSNQTNPTVLIKFFLESNRSVVFIEVPVEHPFFVYHRGWSSWNPQRTYDKFGLKCRKLKIGDTCISLIRRQRLAQAGQQRQKESDQCNLLFSSIKIH